MEKELKQIVENNGKEVFLEADQLMQYMREAGCTEKNIMTTGLVLKACPSVGRVLNQEQVAQAEVNVLITTAVSTTGLSVQTIRMFIGYFLKACGIQNLWTPHLMIREPQPAMPLRPVADGEDETMEVLMARLQADEDIGAAIRDLETLSGNGNIRASYTLGKFYKEIDDARDTQNGKVFFERAANQGYGPANGALADYATRGKRKNIAKAAKYFENPTSLTGDDGREWSNLSAQLLNYLEENTQRRKIVLRLQILAALFTLAAVVLLTPAGSFWSVMCCLTQAVCLTGNIAAKWFYPYLSQRIPCYGLVLSWLFMVLAVL